MGKPRKHKRKGPKSTRLPAGKAGAGCLLCKPHKRQGVNDPPIQDRKAQEAEHAQKEEWPQSLSLQSPL